MNFIKTLLVLTSIFLLAFTPKCFGLSKKDVHYCCIYYYNDQELVENKKPSVDKTLKYLEDMNPKELDYCGESGEELMEKFNVEVPRVCKEIDNDWLDWILEKVKRNGDLERAIINT